MSRERTYQIVYVRFQDEKADERTRRRLKDDLGLNKETVDLIMNLRGQILTLQARMRELESAINIYQAGYDLHLESFRQKYADVDEESLQEQKGELNGV